LCSMSWRESSIQFCAGERAWPGALQHGGRDLESAMAAPL
jgi:hypothetical protein